MPGGWGGFTDPLSLWARQLWLQAASLMHWVSAFKKNKKKEEES